MNELLVNSISKAVDDLIDNSTSDEKLAHIISKHKDKIHFIPIRYRVLGGLLQSMNIQFGNFLESTVRNIVAFTDDNEIIENYSGKKENEFHVSKNSTTLINNYIFECQTQPFNERELQWRYDKLLREIIHEEREARQTETILHDIDLLFRQKSRGRYVYAEIKYNDDHDTGKFVDISRKFLLTYALLVRELKITSASQLKPILMYFTNKKMYFTNKKMKPNKFIPEESSIFRGKRFFEEFTAVKYQDIDEAFAHISESAALNKKFDALCDRILNEGY